MLACIFDMLAEHEPALRYMTPQTAAYSSRVRDVIEQVKEWPMFLLSSGIWGSVKSDSQGPLFKMEVPEAATELPESTATSKLQKHSVSSILAHCKLQAETMQLRIMDAAFVSSAGAEHRASVFKMLQASLCCLSFAVVCIVGASAPCTLACNIAG